MKKAMISAIIAMIGTTLVSAQVAVNSDGSIKVGDLDKAQNVTGNSLDIAVKSIYVYPTANKSASFTIYNNTEQNSVIIGGEFTLSSGKAQASAFNNRFNQPTYIVPTNAGGLCIGTSTKPTGTIYAGTVYSAGQQLTSDRRVKENIRALEGARNYLLSLRPVRFDFNTEVVPLSEEQAANKTGFIAQEVEGVLPELVSYDTLSDLYSMDYVSLIPFLTKGFQEQDSVIRLQQEMIAEQAEMLLELSVQLADLQNMLHGGANTFSVAPAHNPESDDTQADNGNCLFQNTPNPFSHETKIGYGLASTVKEAQIVLYDRTGRELKTLGLSLQQKGEIVLQNGSLPAGVYFYALRVDGVQVAMKRMVLAR